VNAGLRGRRTLPLRGAAARAVLLVGFAVALEWTRVLALRGADLQVPTLIVGGAALCLLGAGRTPAELGLGWSRLAERVLGGLALAGVLLLPAAVRWGGGPILGPEVGIAAIAISVGEEIAYRGALFAALEQAWGPAFAIAGSTAAWTLAHVLSHPPQFLPAVAAAGLVLAAWRWAARDLVGPVIGHVLADLAL
jgi:membrane protease YdiL (CAAX protease family)